MKMCPFEWEKKKSFFRLTTFFFRNKKILFNEQLCFGFLCIGKQKKNLERSKKIFFESLLSNFRKKKSFKNFRIAPKFFFAFQYIKNWTSSGIQNQVEFWLILNRVMGNVKIFEMEYCRADKRWAYF